MKKFKLCIIDDNKAICNSMSMLFNAVYSPTLDIVIYDNPLLFLADYSPDWCGCVIIDLFMPYWNGIDLMQKIKINKNIHVIIISGHANSDVATRSLKEGAYAFISKPFKVEYLLEKIDDALGDK